MAYKPLCDDWTCPARVSCAHHFGRSRAYAAMSDRHGKVGHGEGTPYDRHASEDRQSCEAYKLDKPREWLKPQPGQVNAPAWWLHPW